MRSARQIFGEAIQHFRERAGLSVLELQRKSGTTRQSIYKIEDGRMNLTADQFQKLLAACGVSVEQWVTGLDSETLSAEIPRQYQDLFHMLKTVVTGGTPDMIQSLRITLDALADKTMRLEKEARASPRPNPGREAGAKDSHAAGRREERKPRKSGT